MLGSDSTGISYCGSSTVSVVPSLLITVLLTNVYLVGSTGSSMVSSTGLSEGLPSFSSTTLLTTLRWLVFTDLLLTVRMTCPFTLFSSTSGSDSSVVELSRGLTKAGSSTTFSCPVGSFVTLRTTLLVLRGSSSCLGASSTLFSISFSFPSGRTSVLLITVLLVVTITGLLTTLRITTPLVSFSSSSTVSGACSSGVTSKGNTVSDSSIKCSIPSGFLMTLVTYTRSTGLGFFFSSRFGSGW